MQKKKIIIYSIILVIGALGGFLYWRYVGCLTGTCKIKSNPYLMISYGVLIAWLVADLSIKTLIKPKVKN